MEIKLELEVGMYVRTKEGIIGKLMGYSAYDEDKVAIWTANKGDIQITPVIDKNTIIKASHNLLGNDKEPCLIETGDFVNEEKVCAIVVYKDKRCIDVDRVLYDEEDIKSIVPKQNFESMEYRLGDDK